MTDRSENVITDETGIGSSLKAAGHLAAKQAMSTKIINVTLPAVYRGLGRHIYETKGFVDEFPDHYKEFDRLTAEMKALKSGSESRPAAEGFAGRAKAVATAAKDSAQMSLLKMKVSQSFGKLGESVYEVHGEQSGPTELVKAIAAAKTQAANLNADIARLRSASPGRFLRPTSILIGSVVMLLMACGSLALWRWTSGPTFRDQIFGEWVDTGRRGRTINFQSDQVVLTGNNVGESLTYPYTVDRWHQTAAFTMEGKGDKKIVWTFRLGKDSRLYGQIEGTPTTFAFAREYKGGWHQEGEIDKGQRLSGLQDHDKPIPSDSVDQSSIEGIKGSHGSATEASYKSSYDRGAQLVNTVLSEDNPAATSSSGRPYLISKLKEQLRDADKQTAFGRKYGKPVEVAGYAGFADGIRFTLIEKGVPDVFQP